MNSARANNPAVSPQQVAVFSALIASGTWITNNEIASAVGNISSRCVRGHTARLAEIGLAEFVELFPGRRYRLRPGAADSAHGRRLIEAAVIFGITMEKHDDTCR